MLILYFFLQGQTVKSGSKVVVNWNNRLPPGLAYVMLSRAERLEDIYITGRFDPDKIKCIPEALAEAKRLDEISLTNLQRDEEDMNLAFKFAFVNIRSLAKNFEYLEKDETMLQHETIFVTETWRDPNYQQTPDLNGYASAFANKGRGKGVGVFFKKDAGIETCEETLFQFVKFKTENNTIFCIYLSKGCDFKQVVNSLKNYGFNNKTCLIGDLNFDANKNNDLVRYLKSLNLTQMVKRATHLEGHILDHVYVPQAMAKVTKIKHHYNYYSDHDGISVKFSKPNFQK